MAASVSNESLWSILSETRIVLHNDIVGQELQSIHSKLLKGIIYYSDPVTPLGNELEGLPDTQVKFIGKLGKLLQVSDVIASELFTSYLVSSFRGTHQSLATLLSTERHQQALLISIWKFYYTERLYLLMCLKTIIMKHHDNSHPYQLLFADFMKLLDTDSSLLSSIIDQLAWSCSVSSPNWNQYNMLNSPAIQQAWVSSMLKEQIEIIQCLMAYFECVKKPSPEQVKCILSHFICHGFASSPSYVSLYTEHHSDLRLYVSALEVILVIQSFQLESVMQFVSGYGSDSVKYPFMDSVSLQIVDKVLVGFGSCQEHGLILLAWLMVLYNTQDHIGSQIRIKTIIQQVGGLNVIPFMKKLLLEVSITGDSDSLVGKICHQSLFHLVCMLVHCFDTSKLCNEEDLVCITEKLLSLPENGKSFWNDITGLQLVVQDVSTRFPVDISLLKVCTGLLKAGSDSLLSTVDLISNVAYYAENTSTIPCDIIISSEGGKVWVLQSDYQPVMNSMVLPKGTVGKLSDPPNQLVSWEAPHNGWQQCMVILDDLLREGNLGDLCVLPETKSRASTVVDLLLALLQFGTKEHAKQLKFLVGSVMTVIERFSSPMVGASNLMASCMLLLAEYVHTDPAYVWETLANFHLLPTGTLFSDRAVESGRLGVFIEMKECVSHEYPLTQAFLKLLLSSTKEPQALHHVSFSSSVSFVLQEIFPVHIHWHYKTPDEQMQIGLMCLQLFHLLLTSEHAHLRTLTIKGLMWTPASEALMDIVLLGEGRIVVLLEEQTQWYRGTGVLYIQLTQLALSVLNQLMLGNTHPASCEQECSPLEKLFTTQPAHHNKLHPILAIAQYMFHNHNPHLPTLSIRLMLRLAKVFPMSLLASFGQDSEVICDVILMRLRSETEDINLKVAILDFIASCTSSQPGLLQRLFGMTVTFDDKGKLKKSDIRDTDGGFLDVVLLMLKEHDKSENWDSPLLHATVSLVRALWSERCLAAIAFLCDDKCFWSALMRPFLVCPDGLSLRLASDLISVMSLHLYYFSKPDPQLNKVLAEVASVDCKSLLTWSRHVSTAVRSLTCDLDATVVDPVLVSDCGERLADTARLLLAWRQWCLVVAANRSRIKLEAHQQREVLVDIINACLHQMDSGRGRLRLVSVLAELLMMLVHQWTSCADVVLLNLVWDLVESASGKCEDLPSRTCVAILTMVSRLLQESYSSEISASFSRCFRPVVNILELSLSEAGSHSSAGLAAVVLRQLTRLTSPSQWNSIFAARSTMNVVIAVVGKCLSSGSNPELCSSLLRLALSAVSSSGEVARTAVGLNLSSLICLPLYDLSVKLSSPLPAEWHDVWVLCIDLFAVVLRDQQHFFFSDAVNFAAIHCASLCRCISRLRTSLNNQHLQEAEATIRLFSTMSTFSAQWEKEHKQSFDTMVQWVKGCLGMCFWYMLRPSIVLLLLGKPHSLVEQETYRRVQRLSSTELETDRASPRVILVQNRLLRMSCLCLSSFLDLSPPLVRLLTSDGLPLHRWPQLVGVGFASPNLDNDHSPPQLTYGTLLSGVSLCVRSLTRDKATGGASPARVSISQQQSGPDPVLERSVVLVCLHHTLLLVLSQAARHLLMAPSQQPKSPAASIAGDPTRDAQLVKRELHAELTLFIECLLRQHRRSTSLSPLPSRATSPFHSRGHRFLMVISHLVDQILK